MRRSLSWIVTVAALLLTTNGFVALSPAQAETTATPCRNASDIARLRNPLARVSAKLAAGQPVTIVALGSSSTAGAGASSPAASYPSKLAAVLVKRFPNHPMRVINRGVNGEEARDMLARFEESVAAEKPDLVLWQVGTNAVLRDQPLAAQDTLIHDGIARMKALGADVVLIDPQFAPKVIAKADTPRMVALIAAAAKKENVDLFQRFALMQRWQADEKIPFETFVSADGLHMNDWSYGCFASNLASAIAEAATRPVATVSATAAFH
ncbi:MAG: SGNH/GDSL hydrolase family protein [Pseudolabrys sp.]